MGPLRFARWWHLGAVGALLAIGCAALEPAPAPVWSDATAPPPEVALREDALVVLPFQVDDPADRDRGLALAALVAHQLALHQALAPPAPREDWPRLFGPLDGPELPAWQLAGPPLPPTLARHPARWVLVGRLVGPTLHLRLHDRAAGPGETPPAPQDARCEVDLPAVLAPRLAALRLLDAAGLSPAPSRRGAMVWSEDLDAEAIAELAAALRDRPGGTPPPRWSYLLATERAAATLAVDADTRGVPRAFDRALQLNPAGYHAAAALRALRAQGADALAAELRDGRCADGGRSLLGLVGARSFAGVGVVAGLGGVYTESGCAPAGAVVRTLARLAESSLDDLERAVVLTELGLARKRLGDLDAARADLIAVVDLRLRLGWLAALAEAHVRLGELELARSDHPAARDALGDAVRVARLAGAPHLEAQAANALGLVHRAGGVWDHAVAELERAVGLFSELGDTANTAVALGNLGGVHALLGQHDQAAAMLRRAIDLAHQTRDHGRVAVLTTALATTLHTAGRHDDARAAVATALPLADNDATRATLLSNLAELDLAAGRVDVARAGLASAVGHAGAAGDDTLMGLLRHNQGELELRAGDLPAARGALVGALALRRRVGDRSGEGLTLTSLMNLSRREGDHDLAIFFGKLAVQAHQDVRASAAAVGGDAQRAFVSSREPAYRALAELLFERGRLGEAEEVLGLLKLEELARYTRGAEGVEPRAGVTLASGEEAAEARYRAEAGQVMATARAHAALARRATLTGEQEERLAALAAELEGANGRFTEVVTSLRGAFEGARGGGQVDAMLGIGADLAELPPHTVAVFTLVTDDALRMFVVAPDGGRVAVAAPVGARELDGLVRSYRRILRDPDLDPRRAAERLFDLVIRPVAHHLEAAGAKTVMWSLDGPLRYLPLAALHDGQRWAAERWRHVVFTPASLARLKDRPRLPWQALGAGVSKAHPGFDALPAVPGELDAVVRDQARGTAGVLPGRVLLDEAFTLEELLRELRQPNWQVVHVASHFSLSPGDAAASRLLLGDGAPLSMARLQALTDIFRGVDLLVLSACDTGAAGRGDEVESFAVLAQRKGAKAIVATLWPVADASTGLFFRRFYALHGGGGAQSKAEALRLAQLELLERGGERGEDYSHPFYWAPFVLIGNWL